MKASDIAKLAAGLAAGTITTSYIEEEYGEGVLGSVLAIAGGSIVGGLVAGAMDSFGVSDFIDDIF